METRFSRNGVPIRLTDERWMHITSRHPEMTNCREKVLAAIADPDCVRQGDSGELLAVRDYSDELKQNRVVVVAYREVAANDGFILTAYATDRTSPRRKTVWKR